MEKQIAKKNTREDAVPEMSLRDMLTPLFRHRRAAVITFTTVFVLSILIAWIWVARYYKSSFQVLVEQERTDPPVTTGESGTVLNRAVTTDQVASEVSLLQGQDMYRTVVSSCGLADEPSLFESIFPPKDTQQAKAARVELATRRLLKKVKVEAQKTSDVIDVSYGRAGDPHTPSCVLQTLSKLYVEKHLQLQRPAGTTDLFTDEASKHRKALLDSEMRLADFSRQERISAPDLVRADMAQQLANSEAAFYQARQAVAANEKRIESLNTQMSAIPSRSTTTEVTNSSNLLLQNLQATLLSAQMKRTQLLLKYEPDYPLVREAEQEIAQTQEAISKAQESKFVNRTTDRDPTYEFLRQDLAKTQADLASAKATAAALHSSIKDMRLRMVKLDEQALKQGDLLREAKAREGNYLLYLTKQEQERSSEALTKKGIANVAIAVPPTVPVLPAYSPWLVMIVGLLLAILSGVGAALLVEYFDPSFRTPSEVATSLKVPVLACVPRRAA